MNIVSPKGVLDYFGSYQKKEKNEKRPIGEMGTKTSIRGPRTSGNQNTREEKKSPTRTGKNFGHIRLFLKGN